MLALINVSSPLLLGSIKCFTMLSLAINIISNDTVNFVSTYDSYFGTPIDELSYFNFTELSNSINSPAGGEIFFKITTLTTSNTSYNISYACNPIRDAVGLIWFLTLLFLLCIVIIAHQIHQHIRRDISGKYYCGKTQEDYIPLA